VKADAYVDLVILFLAFPILYKGALHLGCGFDALDRIIKLRQDGVADRLHNTAAFVLDDREQQGVVAADHRHVLDVALLLGVRGRSLYVAEKNRHRSLELLELLLHLGTLIQQFLKFVLFGAQSG
jgi:hypothetical protein